MVIEIGGNPCFFLHQVLGHPIFTQIQIEKGTNSFDPHQGKDSSQALPKSSASSSYFVINYIYIYIGSALPVISGYKR